MRFMVIVKSDEKTDVAGAQPSAEDLQEMGKFNEELVKAGVMLAGEGLLPSAEGFRIQYSGTTEARVVDGPFAESKELIAGFWILQVKDRAEVVEWMKRAPFREGEIEIRRIAEMEDFDNATPEIVEREQKLREQAEAN
ncbi:dehydrogenase [Amycolatopsis sp. WAC 04182]|uniref:YciI family protein n=1 Tax=Amycolatopsis sp. WAC 04182 TaxID=2203198 RepID=UPI000F78D9D2|nr:YciI family protein [Amycolatopsis sp. WAC 04182]RSN53553.1 dehydrogenase [Amycolatopsis sp. WAC 04182]